MVTVHPIPLHFEGDEDGLTEWQRGQVKPEVDGYYLREFDEGNAISEFWEGEWLSDGFFPSDIQDAPWRGSRTPFDARQASMAL